MATEVKKKQGESFDALYRRFQRRVQQGGVVKETRRKRYAERAPKRNTIRNSRVRGLKIAAKRLWLIRTGKATEADFGRRSVRR